MSHFHCGMNFGEPEDRREPITFVSNQQSAIPPVREEVHVDLDNPHAELEHYLALIEAHQKRERENV